MTFIKISEVAGCSERTVRRTAKALWPDRAFSRGGADLSENDALEIMAKLPKRNMVSGQKSGQMSAQDIGLIVRDTVAAMLPLIVSAVRGVAPESVPALPAPALATRDELRRLVNQGAKAAGGYREAWGQLYTDMYYRLHRNVKECAKNRGMDTLDYVEEEGLLPDAVAIAREIFA